MTTEQWQHYEVKKYLLDHLFVFLSTWMPCNCWSILSTPTMLVLQYTISSGFLIILPYPSTLKVFTILAECLVKMTGPVFGFPAVLSLSPLYFIANMFSCSLKTSDPFCISLSPGKSLGKLFLLLLTLFYLCKRYMAKLSVVYQLSVV